MAKIELKVELEEVDNENLDKIPDQIYQVLATAGRSTPSQIDGVVTDVTETDRTEDEDEEEEVEE